MITVEFGRYRFYDGDNVTYTNSSYGYLFEQAATAGDVSMRRYAAAGIVRGLLDLPVVERHDQEFFDAVNWGVKVILDVLNDQGPQGACSTTQSFIDGLPPVNGVLDATSIAATNTALRQNNPRTTRAAIERHSPVDRPKLVIALGHGGVLASCATFTEMPEGTLVYPVRFSRHKAKHNWPSLSNTERQLIHDFSEERDVIVHDEDRNQGMGTITSAVSYFASEFLRPTYGVTPTTGRHPNCYEPQVMWYGEDGRVSLDSYAAWSNELEELRASIVEETT